MPVPDLCSISDSRSQQGREILSHMDEILKVSIGQASDRGRKSINQDFHVAMTPGDTLLRSKGVAIAVADGISSSDVSQQASETALKGFIEDYYSTPESWTVKTSVLRVMQATNSWLYAQSRNGSDRFNLDRGYVCTFSAMVIKSTTGHVFHAGDTRVYRLSDGNFEQLTEDHRLWSGEGKSYLSRALGMRDRLELDYATYSLDEGDCFIIATDGVYEFCSDQFIVDLIGQYAHELDRAAEAIIAEALEKGSTDNLTLQILRIDSLPEHNITELHQQAGTLPFPPELRPRMNFDGFHIERSLHHSSRSHVYLATELGSGLKVILKIPSVDLRGSQEYLERFLMEDWIAQRVDNAHLLKPVKTLHRRHYLYNVTEYVEGQTLSRWMTDNPNPDIEKVRDIVQQIARGLNALHRQQMLHQDLRPANIMIDMHGTVKIIDFGSVSVAGIDEINGLPQHHILGTAQYTAPEYFLGEPGSIASDLFSLAVIAYQMLSGRLPYGTEVARASTRAAQLKLQYQSVLDDERSIPMWVDAALCKALHTNPARRYDTLSEFIYDLRQPNPQFLQQQRAPLMERNPILFWKSLSLLLFVLVIYLLVQQGGV